jgi:hypothetical protein
VEQHALTQPEHPRREFFIGLPALGDAGDDVPLLIEIGQAGIHRSGCGGSVQLIMSVRIEARGIAARAIQQGAATLGMPLAGGRRIDEAESGHPSKHTTGGDQEVATRKFTRSTCSLSDHP